MNLINGFVLFSKRVLCRHKFDMADLDRGEGTQGKRVKWPCSVCGKVFTAHCGLDILSHGTPTQDKWHAV